MLELCKNKAALPSLSATEAGVRIEAQIEAYGLDQPFFSVYQSGDGGVLSVLDGAATLLAGEDSAEAFLFLRMSPQVTSLRTDGVTARRFAAQYGLQTRVGTVMRAPSNMQASGVAASITPADFYPLARRVFGDGMPPFDAWYADVTHRLRRDRCRLVAVREGEIPVSGGMTVAETATAWLLGAVCTEEAARCRGYAAACVTALVAEGQARRKEVFIAAKNPAAARFYERLGFIACGEWGQVDFEK